MYKPNVFILITVLMNNLTAPAQATIRAEIPATRAIAAIIGEVSGEGGANLEIKYKAMLACAHAIRNRGTLKGVYGEHSPHVKKEPEWVWKLARKAWIQSAYERSRGIDPTMGATHWENIEAFGEPRWKKDMIVTVKIGRHTYMRKARV